MDERALFNEIAAGSERAFKEAYSILLADFGSYILKMVKSQDALNEVLQESLIRLWINRDKLPDLESPRAWFFRILANECYRYLQKNSFSHVETDSLVETLGHSDTEQQLAFRETQRLIQEALLDLSPRQLTIYRMSREQGLSLPEIAKELGLSRDYVKKVLMTALEKIRKSLIAAGYSYSALLCFKIFFLIRWSLNPIPRVLCYDWA